MRGGEPGCLDQHPGLLSHGALQELVCVVVSIFVFRMIPCEEVPCLRTSQLS